MSSILTFAVAIATVVLFIEIIKRLGLLVSAQKVGTTAKLAAQTVADKNLSDDEKEQRMQSYAVTLFKQFFILCGGFALALLIPTLLVYGLGLTPWLDAEAIFALMMSWTFIIVASVLSVVLLVVKPRSSGKVPSADTDPD